MQKKIAVQRVNVERRLLSKVRSTGQGQTNGQAQSFKQSITRDESHVARSRSLPPQASAALRREFPRAVHL
jgi:hypothetical protein